LSGETTAEGSIHRDDDDDERSGLKRRPENILESVARNRATAIRTHFVNLDARIKRKTFNALWDALKMGRNVRTLSRTRTHLHVTVQ
jgi:hypothetical protein